MPKNVYIRPYIMYYIYVKILLRNGILILMIGEIDGK